MSPDILKILENIKKQNLKISTWRNKKLYQLLWKIIYSPGKNDKIIELLKSGKFIFSPKKIKNNIYPSANDKVVLNSIKLILESIYESLMSENSYGFRKNSSCHNALNTLRYKWPGIEWFITFDLKDIFSSIENHQLLSLLEKKISDDRFLQLINQYLKKEYFLNFKYRKSIAETPKGYTINPILFNIFLSQLDNFIEIELKQKYNIGKRKPTNPEYIKIQSIKDKKQKEIEKNKFRCSGKIFTQRKTDKFIRIKYVRYADKFIVGICGSYETAKKIQIEILDKIKLMHLNCQKSQIIDSYNPIEFLGTIIQARKPAIVGIERNNKIRSLPTGMMTIKCDINKLVNKLYKYGFCNAIGFPLCCNKYINFSLEEIVTKYNLLLWKLITYYKPTDNFFNFGRIQYILQYSLAKTIAGKLKISMPQVFRKFSKNIKISDKIYFNKLNSFKNIVKWSYTIDDFDF